MTDTKTKIDELQQRADQTTEAITELERLYQQQGLIGTGETPNPKAIAEDMEDLGGLLDIIEAQLSPDTPDVSELSERVDSENVHFMGDGLRVVDADALDKLEEDTPSIPLDPNQRGGSHD